MEVVINTYMEFIVSSQTYKTKCHSTDMVSVNLLFFILRYCIEMKEVHLFQINVLVLNGPCQIRASCSILFPEIFRIFSIHLRKIYYILRNNAVGKSVVHLKDCSNYMQHLIYILNVCILFAQYFLRFCQSSFTFPGRLLTNYSLHWRCPVLVRSRKKTFP